MSPPLFHVVSLLALAIPAVVIRQRKAWRRRESVFLYFEDSAGVIFHPKGEIKGSVIPGPVAKQCVSVTFSRCSSGRVRPRAVLPVIPPFPS